MKFGTCNGETEAQLAAPGSNGLIKRTAVNSSVISETLEVVIQSYLNHLCITEKTHHSTVGLFYNL